jgi:hypothetical protein
MGIIEQLTMNILAHYFTIPHHLKKIMVCSVSQVMEDFLSMQNRCDSYFEYYAENGLISFTILNENIS